MLKFINAVLLFLPIVLVIYYFLEYKIESAKNNKYYIRKKLDDSFVLIISAIISVIVICINVCSCLFVYKYKLLNHYLSSTFILTSILVLLVGTYIVIKIHGLSNIIWAFRSCKVQRKIKIINERLSFLNSKSYATEEKEKTLETLNDMKKKNEKLLLELTVCYIDEAQNGDNKIIKRIFK